MSCPGIPDYRHVEFHAAHRPMVVAAMLSADGDGVIAPPDGVRWFQRDFNEMVSRDWARQHRMRPDRMWSYRLTDIGHCVAESFRDDGYTFDGWDLWEAERLMVGGRA